RQASAARDRCDNAGAQRTKPRRAADDAEPAAPRAVHVGIYRRRHAGPRDVLGRRAAAAEAVLATPARGTRAAHARQSRQPRGTECALAATGMREGTASTG